MTDAQLEKALEYTNKGWSHLYFADNMVYLGKDQTTIAINATGEVL